MDQPEVHDAIAAMRRVADEYGDWLLIGEAYLPFDRLMAYYGVGLTGFHLPFNFELIFTQWKPTAVASLAAAYEAALPEGAWPNWVLGNHDRPRVASRIGPDQARVAAMLLLTLRGTPTIYKARKSACATCRSRTSACRTRGADECRASAGIRCVDRHGMLTP
jgi:alpha-glucosidase